MQRNLLAVLIGFAFGTSYAVPNEGGNADDKVIVPENVQSWVEQGKKEGKAVAGLTARAERRAEATLIAYGLHFAAIAESDSELPAIANDWLTGYAMGFDNPNTGKVRKSEAKAVLEAFLRHDQQHERVKGVDATTKEIVKESKSAEEWLTGHNTVKGREGYAGLIAMAKEIRGKATGGQGAGGGARRKTTVTDKQHGEIVENVALMNSGQAAQVVEKATAQLSKLPKFEQALFREMLMVANQIKMKSNDPAHLKVASEVIDLVQPHLDRIAISEQRAASGQPQTTPSPAKAEGEMVKA